MTKLIVGPTVAFISISKPNLTLLNSVFPLDCMILKS